MANTERDNHNQVERELNSDALKEAAEQGRERIAEQLERRSPESRAERNTQELKQEALEQASPKHEKETNHTEKNVDSPERARKAPSTKRQREAAFTRVMDDARSHMSPGARTFSKIIHNPIIEKSSEIAGSTIARPNAILSGSISAFVIVLGVLLIARYYGYPLSGAETILAFIAGWVIGIIYDFLRTMITGKR
jgi:hypothetical protein